MSAIANSNQPEDKSKTSRVQSYWSSINLKKFASLLMAIALCFYLTACGGDSQSQTKSSPVKIESSHIIEVSPPPEIQRLSRLLDRYEPQVSIVSPKPDEVLNDAQVAVKFDVKNLPIFKNADLGLGPHIHVILDNQEYKAVYDLNQAATFEHLSAGTHTIRAFASRPWHESFKNQGAYAQATFHVLTKTGENTPKAKTPLLTYSRPVGTYGAEPIMLDFYIQNAPLHLLAKDDETIEDWQVRATVDGQSFTFDRWEPIYLKGFKQGKNWVKLELLEEDGDAIANVFNSTAHLIDFQPNGTDTLSRLVSGEKIANIEAIVDPNYVPPTPVVIPAPVESATPVEPAATSTPTVTTEPKTESKIEPKNELTDKLKQTGQTSVIPVMPTKSTPETIKVVPTTEPSKVTPLKVKSAPVSTPAPVVVEPVKPVELVKPVLTTKPVELTKPVAPIELKTSPEPTKTIAPSPSKDYLKGLGFNSHKVLSNQQDVVKSPETKPETKPTETPSAVTDLSTTTLTPIKVLTKSGK